MTTSGQHGTSHQNTVEGIQTAHRVTQIQRHALSDTRRNQQNPTLTGRAHQLPGLHRIRRRVPVHPRQHTLADQPRIGPHPHEPPDESSAVQPHPMPDQQLNGRLRAQQPRGMRSQSRRQLIEARSKSGIPSASLITRS